MFSDPFSWSADVSKEEDWLGGTDRGLFSGTGFENVLAILKGEKIVLYPPWNVDEQGELWWKIRNHRNHFEMIRSCFIKASR